MDTHGRSVLVTGAGSGIGRSLALAWAGEQARLTLVGRRRSLLEEVAAEVRARGGQAEVAPADLAEPGVAERVVASATERFGGLDVLVNNAGNVRAGRLERLGEAEVRAQIEVNLTAPILLTRAALPALRAGDGGLVVLVSSAIALVGLPFYTTYAGAKAGVAHFGEALRRELYGEGVGVLTVYPGATRTPMMETSTAGPELGFDYESPDDLAVAVLEAIRAGSLTLVRGGPARTAMIQANREDPQELDRQLAQRKAELEQAVARHSSL